METAPTHDGLYEESMRQWQVKHALKTALACCLAAGLVYYFRLTSGQLAPVFVFLLMTSGMPSPRLNWLLAHISTAIGAIVSGLIVVTFHDALFAYLAVILLWVFICLLFSNWFPVPATLAALVSAVGIFVFLQGTVGDALWYFEFYELNFLVAGFSVVVVHTLLWPQSTRKVFMQRLTEVYSHLEQQCRNAAERMRSGESPPAAVSPEPWAPFRQLRELLFPELRQTRETSNPFARMILACRSLNMRLWFFNRAIAPAAVAGLPAEQLRQLSSILDRCAGQLHALLEGAFDRQPVPPVDVRLIEDASAARLDAGQTAPTEDVLVAHGLLALVLHRLVLSLQTATISNNALVTSFRKGSTGDPFAWWPFATGTRLIDIQSVRSGAKLVVILVLLLLEEAWLGFPGKSQVAFFATFFATTANLGRQNKTDLVGLAGLLGGFAYGVVAAYLTSHLSHFPLLLALVFLGEFLASLVFQKLPRFSVAGLQGGLAVSFAYLATTGPEWGSFDTVKTRHRGLVVAGFTAVVVHAYLWPVLPMRQLRASIAAVLRATSDSLAQLFGAAGSNWQGAPPTLEQTVTRARDLLDDARYLPGPDHADPAYYGILSGLQEIDANLEFVHFLVALEDEQWPRHRLFEVIGEYAEQARRNLETVARQFELSPRHAATIEAVRWQSGASGRWESASRDIAQASDDQIDPWRPAVIARCLDHIAQAVEEISHVSHEINVRNRNS